MEELYCMAKQEKRIELPSLEEIMTAYSHVSQILPPTPLVPLHQKFSDKEIFLKLENFNPFGSFKVRAAYNILLSERERLDGKSLITASAGNFGQGLAYVAKELGRPITIVVPETSSKVKMDSMEKLGATLIKLPFAEWWKVLSERYYPGLKGEFIHPVAEWGTILGNATIGVEIANQMPDVDAIIAPYGGGGLITGIGSVVKKMLPNTLVYAAETEASTPLSTALAMGEPVKVDHKKTYIDGMGGIRVLDDMWPLVTQVVSDVICVPVEEVSSAIRSLALDNNIIAEGAGAASVAAGMSDQAGKGKIVCIVSGGNIDMDIFHNIICGKL